MKADVEGSIAKLTPVAKTDSEKAAFNAYKKEVHLDLYELSLGASVSATLYGFAFDAEQTDKLTHIKTGRRMFKRTIQTLAEEEKEDSLKIRNDRPILSEGIKFLRETEPGYDTALDIQKENDEATLQDKPLRTKNVRSKGKSTIRKERERNVASDVYTKEGQKKKKPKTQNKGEVDEGSRNNDANASN